MGRRWKTRGTSKGRGFIGPVGPAVVVEFADHASNDRFARRVEPLGITLEQVVRAVRLPNGGRGDRQDPDEPGRFFRFVRLDGTTIRRRRFKLVCIELEQADGVFPGRIEVLTIIDLNEGAPPDA